MEQSNYSSTTATSTPSQETGNERSTVIPFCERHHPHLNHSRQQDSTIPWRPQPGMHSLLALVETITRQGPLRDPETVSKLQHTLRKWVLAKYIHSYNDYRLVCECAELVDQLFLGGHLTRPSTRYRQRFGLSMEHVEVEITQGNERCGGRWPSHSALMSRGSGLAPFVLIDVDTKHATCVPEVLEAIVHELAHAYIAVFGCTESLCKFDVARGSSGGLHRGPVHSLLVYIFGEMRSWFVDVPQLRSFGLRYELGCNSPPGIQVITVVEVVQAFIHCCELVREKLCDE